MTAVLLQDIYSAFNNKKPLGVKGEQVQIIADHSGTLIVEASSKERFTVKESEIKRI
jgi:hypothetical protein